MRTAFLSLLCVGLFFVSSCGSDDDNNIMITTADLEGSWDLSEYDNDFTLTILGESVSSKSSISNSTVVITFASGGTWSSTGSYDLTVESMGTTETDTVTDGFGSGTYAVVDGKVQLEGVDAGDEADTEGAVPFDVVAFSANSRIELSGDVDEVVEVPFFGTTGIESKARLVLVR